MHWQAQSAAPTLTDGQPIVPNSDTRWQHARAADPAAVYVPKTSEPYVPPSHDALRAFRRNEL